MEAAAKTTTSTGGSVGARDVLSRASPQGLSDGGGSEVGALFLPAGREGEDQAEGKQQGECFFHFKMLLSCDLVRSNALAEGADGIAAVAAAEAEAAVAQSLYLRARDTARPQRCAGA